MDLSLNATRVVAVAVLSPNLPVGAMDDQLAAVASCLGARYGDGLSLGGLDDRGALCASRDDGEAAGAGGDVDGFTHDSCRYLRVYCPWRKGTPSLTTEREGATCVKSNYFREQFSQKRGVRGG